LDHAPDADVVDEPDHVCPLERVRGRAKWSVELLDHLCLALEHQYVGAAQRAHVERLVTRIEDEYMLHPGRNVPDRADLNDYRPMARSTASCSSGDRATEARPRSSSFM